MKKITLGFLLLWLASYSRGATSSVSRMAMPPNGLECVVVEKYYVSNAADSVGSIGTLPAGSVTYRIYVDMLPGYKFQAAYGVPGHTLTLSTTTSFFNNEDRGATTPTYSKTQARGNTVMLDSWLSVGAACVNNFGILKSEDSVVTGGATVVNNTVPPILQNADPSAGIPLTVQDGLYPGVPEGVTFVGITSTDLAALSAVSQYGNLFTTSNGSWASLNGSSGPIAATNKVLIAQITTDGIFHYELNIQIGTPSGGTENYVASNPVGTEIMLPCLTGTLPGCANPPTADAGPSQSVCAGGTISLSGIMGGAATSSTWTALSGSFSNAGSLTSNYMPSISSGTVTLTLTTDDPDGGGPCVAASSSVDIQVTPSVTPSVNITANPGSTICSGQSVTFTATPTNGGSTPSYQWKKNGINVGTNSITYTDASLSNVDVIQLTMISNATCASPNSASSNMITMIVTASVTPSVVIASNPGSTICSGQSVTFTATPTNGGSTPSYQWKKNGTNVGVNSSSYSDASISNGDQVQVTLTSNSPCASPTSSPSNTITMNVTASVTPSVVIAANPGSTICSGQSVTFTATPTTGGSTPSYQWKKNGTNVGVNSSSYSDASISNGDQVQVTLTSNSPCASPTSAPSNMITMNVSASVTPSVVIVANPGSTICSGQSVTFTATPTNGGSTPSYQWKKNGTNVGVNSSSFSDASISNGDQVQVTMTSNSPCASPTSAPSNMITMNVSSSVTPSVVVAANPGSTICSGQSVTFTATPTNGGSTPSYQWKKNGANVGVNSSAYSDASISNGDQVQVTMTSGSPCASPTSAPSNMITMNVTSSVTPSVVVAANPGSTICSGQSVTFSATPTNGGSTPSYQWKKNGTNVGTNSATYIDASLVNGNQIQVTMTSNATCASPGSANSSTIAMTVTSTVTPSVAVSANPGSTICSGQSVTYTATPTNGGSTPSYQWKKNGTNVGVNSSTYVDASIANGDQVQVTMTSNSPCASPTSVPSNMITMNVSSSVTPAVVVAANPGSTICSGQSVTYTATPTNGGSTPSYQWKKNGTNVGVNNASYSDASISNGDQIQVLMTSSSPCASPASIGSNMISMIVNTCGCASPAIADAGLPQTIAAGGTVTLAGSISGSASSATWSAPSGTFVDINVLSTMYTPSIASGTVILTLTTNDPDGPGPCVAGISTVTITVTPVSGSCGDFLSYERGVWGNAPVGNNAGAYLANYFATSYPNGLTIGDCGNYLTLTSASTVREFLPSGGRARTLNPGTMVNPTNSSHGNNFAGQLVALNLTITFDSLYPSFAPSAMPFKNLIVNGGSFDGWSVQQVYDEANHVIGCGGSQAYIRSLVSALDNINESWSDGVQQNNYLKCPGSLRMESTLNSQHQVQGISKLFPNPTNGSFVLNYQLETSGSVVIDIYNSIGIKIKTLLNNYLESGTYSVGFDMNDLNEKTGFYMIQLVTDDKITTFKLLFIE